MSDCHGSLCYIKTMEANKLLTQSLLDMDFETESYGVDGVISISIGFDMSLLKLGANIIQAAAAIVDGFVTTQAFYDFLGNVEDALTEDKGDYTVVYWPGLKYVEL
jgi:hypothetical protein